MRQKEGLFKGLLIILGLIFLPVLFAQADIVKTINGKELNGKVIDLGDSVRIELLHGSVDVPKNEIIEIIPAKTIPEQHEEKIASINPTDEEALFSLALWCRSNRWFSKMKEELRKVIRLNPDHEQARRMLGYRKLNGEWLTKTEYMSALGYVKYKGKWQPTELAIELARLEGLEKALKARRKEMKRRERMFERTQKRAITAALRAQHISKEGWYTDHLRARNGEFEFNYNFEDGSGFSVRATASAEEIIHKNRASYLPTDQEYPRIYETSDNRSARFLHNNKGHGNNLDHDDEDNPGKGKGSHGADSGYDDDGYDDDEKQLGKDQGKDSYRDDKKGKSGKSGKKDSSKGHKKEK